MARARRSWRSAHVDPGRGAERRSPRASRALGSGQRSSALASAGKLRERAAERDEIARRGAVDRELHREPLEVADVRELAAHFGAKTRAGVTKSSTASSRRRMSATRASGARRRRRRRRAPGAVFVSSICARSDPRASPSTERTSSRCACVASSRRSVSPNDVRTRVARSAGARPGSHARAIATHRAAARRATTDEHDALASVAAQQRPRTSSASRASIGLSASSRTTALGSAARSAAVDRERLGPHEHLARVEADELRDRGIHVGRFARRELPGRQRRAPRSRHDAVVALDRDEVVVLARLEPRVVVHDPRRNDAHHLARHDPLHLRRVGHLLADRDLEALLEEPLDVRARRVMGHARHRASRPRRPCSGGQRQIERARGDDGVVVEELVEVPHPEEEERVRDAPPSPRRTAASPG